MSSCSDALKEQFAEDDSVIVHIVKSNESLKTFDGIAIGAERVFVELMDRIREIVDQGDTVRFFSLVGYSLGGLFSRYLIGMLESVGFFNNVAPVVFATFATPHAGTYFHSRRAKARVLNAFGSRLLGITGGELFNCNETLQDLADPEGRYMIGLRRFKRHLLFANATHDRTVPFWTSFLAVKNPFRHLDHVRLCFYDHSLVVKHKEVRPFLVDMETSVYDEKELHPPKLTRRDKLTRVLLFVLLPIFLPTMLTVLATGTVVSRLKALYYTVRPRPQESTELFRQLSHELSKRQTARLEMRNRPHHHHDLEAGNLAEGALENMLELVEPQEGEQEESEELLSGKPRPALNGGCCGLLDDTPYELGINSSVRKILDNLNTLPWEKYAVCLSHFNAHGEIVNRRKSTGQGLVLQKFFATIVSETYTKVVLESQTASSL